MSEVIITTKAELKLLFFDALNDWSTANNLLSQFQQTKNPQLSGTATRQQAAEFLNISLPTLGELTKTGKVKGRRLGKRVLYHWSDLEAALTIINTGGTQ